MKEKIEVTFTWSSEDYSRSNQHGTILCSPSSKQLLSETFLSTGFSFRDIGLDYLKWDTLYILI